MLTLTELCLQDGTNLLPFAVLVESDRECHWGIATNGVAASGWPEHVAEKKYRRANDAWAFAAWEQSLADLAKQPAEARQTLLAAISRNTPGIVIRMPRKTTTTLPARIAASQWARRRLHDRAESIAACIARRLSENSQAHWASSVFLDDGFAIEGDWIIENRPKLRSHGSDHIDRDGQNATHLRSPAPSNPVIVDGIAVVHVISSEQISDVVRSWQANKAWLKTYPYGIAVVRNYCDVMVSAAGCVVGDRFAAPESVAIAATRAAWSGAFALEIPDYDDES
ncbi:hypothetical protein [Zhongshania sp. BJYM1]|uniref:hypothetical protein n=1 Tax=Zhongshania aquatica TaxID=2965069 RepID=UPI0022B305DC|nr:hypothetical protein [Marortus sp. BJYM1]